MSCCSQDQSPRQRHIAEAKRHSLGPSSELRRRDGSGSELSPTQSKKLMGKVTQSAQKEPEPPAGNGPQYLFTAQNNLPLQETSFFGWRETSTANRSIQTPPSPARPQHRSTPVGPAAPRACLCVWVGGWVRVSVCVCVCACVDEGNVKRQQ